MYYLFFFDIIIIGDTMFKLNNKGFAVSTILYGLLSLIIIILMIVFGLMKSSRDMNKDLVENIEGKINNCVLNEVELEKCYFNNNIENCRGESYYDCVQKKDDGELLADKVQIGDFVNYTAGKWTSTKDIDNSTFISLGGYSLGQSRDSNTLTCGGDSQYDGWRVLAIDDNNVKLIHAGIPECMKVDVSKWDSTRGSHIDYYESFINNVSNWQDYINEDYAEYASIFSLDEFEYWDENIKKTSDTLAVQGYSYETMIINTLIHIQANYVLGGVSNEQYKFIDANPTYSQLTQSSLISYYSLGVRPVVTLKKDVKTSGAITNTYGMTTWILS